VVRSPQGILHQHFFDLPQFLQPGDLLVLNNTRVIPARLYGHKLKSDASAHKREEQQPPSSEPRSLETVADRANRALVEVFLLEEKQPNRWLTLVRPGRRLRPGAIIQFGPTSQGTIINGHICAIDEATGGRIVDFTIECAGDHDCAENAPPKSLWEILPEMGEVPLPPYISNPDVDTERYQTVYGDRPGAVAAPTAGLHFTPSLFQQLQAMGVAHTFITLHVGVGTFRPVESGDITTHQMHGEWINVPQATVTKIEETKQRGGRVIAVGTTAARAIEGASAGNPLAPFQGKTDIFIYPGYQWQIIDGLITNFHLPKSSLMMMVSALIGRQRLLDIYQEAIAQQYRFYSFGDAMLILPNSARN
ncbi:MAG: tRNA preQ1(34) S-adenosylmethionine ribosyltransferase-isomerase QueA, partial [Merismopedia sp. SIO2A8]|nr:tRNA preQ1(34) S-adenosylmethionine ribosyltransferase-isomerase QueA [Merismopedia sp. SIO2A8]